MGSCCGFDGCIHDMAHVERMNFNLKNQQVWPESNMKDFYVGVVKSFAEHCSDSEFINYHGPETHGHEPLHSQFTLINPEVGNAFKVKLGE